MLACVELTKGSGPPLVFLHGFLGKSTDWIPVCEYLSHLNCFGIDLPGHGKSPFTPDFCNMMPCFNEPVHLIGYSMGGRLALQYAKKFPERICQLTLLSTHPGLNTFEERQRRIEHDQKWANRILNDDFDVFLQDWYAQPIFGGFTPPLKERREQNQNDLAKALVHYSLGNQTHFYPKAHYLVGEGDEKLRVIHPKATIILHAAHAIHLENPKDVAEQILKWEKPYVF